MNLRPMYFDCPFCNREKLTFITDEKYQEVINRTQNIQSIFPPQIFPAGYREIFISHICNSCWQNTFNPDGEEDGSKDCDVPSDASNADIQNLENYMSELYDQYARQ